MAGKPKTQATNDTSAAAQPSRATVPNYSPSANTAAQAPINNTDMVKGRVALIVEDDDAIRTSLVRLFSKSFPGLQVHEAEDGAVGEQMLHKLKKLDIIFTDFQMPTMNGLEFLDRANKAHPKSTRVMITGYPKHDVRHQAGHVAKVNNFLVKPIEPENVILLMKDILQQMWLRDLTGG